MRLMGIMAGILVLLFVLFLFSVVSGAFYIAVVIADVLFSPVLWVSLVGILFMGIVLKKGSIE